MSGEWVLGKCSHSQPIYIPCQNCVDARIARIKSDVANSVSAKSKEATAQFDKDYSTALTTLESRDSEIGKLTQLIKDLRLSNASSIEMIVELKKKISDLEIINKSHRSYEYVTTHHVDHITED